MKVTGYQLREAIKRWQLRRDTAAAQFTDSLKAFPGEDKPDPREIMERLYTAESSIAVLQAAQARYNLSIVISNDFSLHEAVKLVGGAGRREKMWRNVAAPQKNKYEINRDERDKDAVVARPTVSQGQAMELADQAAGSASFLRSAIAVANATERDLDELSAALFE